MKYTRVKFKDLPKEKKPTYILYLITRITVVLILIVSLLLMIFRKNDEIESRYGFISIQCLVLMIASFIAPFVEKNFKVEIPEMMEILFIIFCIGSILIGEIGGAYANNSWWDGIMHTMSGSLITIVAFSLIDLLNKNEKLHLQLNPFFVCLFAFCFALTIGVVWEIYEYASDAITGSNMQRYMDSITLENFQGHNALSDTMQDFILDLIGALIVTILGYFDLSKKKRLNLMILPVHNNEERANENA